LTAELYPDYRIDLDSLLIDGHRYAIESLINRGGYGTILKLRDPENRAYAMKTSLEFDIHFTNNRIIRPEQVKESSKSLFAEIAIFSRMVVNPLLKVYSSGTTSAMAGNREIVFPFILMELANTTLKELIEWEADGRLHIPFAEKRQMIIDLLESLRFLHQSHLVHRDLSPNNVFVVDRGDEAHYVIGDYGTSKDISNLDRSSTTSHLITKADYFDPERFKNPNFRYDHRTDIWSAGVIITEIACGNFWTNLAARDFQTAVRDGNSGFDELFQDTNISQRLHPELLKILKKASASDPACRYDQVGTMIRDCQRFFELHPASFFTPGRYQQSTLTITVNIKLPLDPDCLDEKVVTEFKGNTNFEFDYFCHYEIRFPVQVSFTSAKVRHTTLFQAICQENTLTLQFRRDRFLKKYRRYIHDLEQSSGYLTLQFRVATRYRQ